MVEEIDLIQDSVWECLDFLTSEKNAVIWMDNDGKRPDGLYTTLKIDPYDIKQNDEYINLPDGNIKQLTRVSFVISVQMYRNGALNNAYDLNRKLRKKSVLDYCAIKFHEKNLCLIVREVSEVRDITTIIETNNEQRAQFDVILDFTSVTIDRGVDDKGLGAEFPVNITGEYKKNEEDNNPITETIVIDK